MASDDWNSLYFRLKRKREIEEEEESRKKVKFIINAIMSVISIMIAWYGRTFLVKEPSHDWDRERRCYLDRLYNGTEVTCVEQLRLSKSAFKKLCRILHENGGLVRTRNVSIEESVAIFLRILSHNHKNRVIGFDFYRSKETISRQFKRVLHAMLRISKDFVKYQSCVMSGSDIDRWKWFENCLGALDGTHIPVTVFADDKPRYRNRKGDISTNVLGVCAPDMKYVYILPGWEGSASDARVLRDALHRNNPFRVPLGKYYLVDAGYANGPGFLAPYRATKYHLNEWHGNRPTNAKELFNRRHSSARNIIERSFGLLKKRWSILRTPSFFNIKTQIRIINACCVLHNFIRIEQQSDPILEDLELRYLNSVDADIANQPIDHENNDRIRTAEPTDEWTAFRDTLADQMWQDYQARRLQQS